jgi:hypothetical protein
MTDTPTGGNGFDPRFNPAFQPGYDPSVHARPPVVPERAAPPGRGESPPTPGATEPGEQAAREPALREPAVREPGSPTAVPAEPTEDALVVRRFDPYLAGLWLLSVVFVGLGLLTVRYIADRMDRLNATGGGSSFDYNLVLVYTIAAPLLVFLGLATATGTLFLLAARRRT